MKGKSTLEQGLRWKVLLALVLALTLLFAVFAGSTYHSFVLRRRSEVRLSASQASALLAQATRDSAAAMSSLASVLMRDPALAEALDRRDREALLERARPIFQDIAERVGITHFYFHGADRVNILRVHEPALFGDTIKRFTMLEAERTGQPSLGNERGETGAYTLRYVVPWRSGDRLLGYLELGKEFQDVAAALHVPHETELFVLVDKKDIRRETWEHRQSNKKRLPAWDTFSSDVVVFSTVEALPAEITSMLSRSGFRTNEPFPTIEIERRTLQCVVLPINDVQGQDSSKLLIIRDVSSITTASRSELVMGSIPFVVVSVGLLVAFYFFLGGIQGDLKDRSRRLTDTNAQLENEVAERVSAQAKVEKALEAAEAATQAAQTSLAQREEAVRELSAAKLALEDQLETIERQRSAIRELSTPIIDVWENVLTLPIIGHIDRARAAEMTDRLLHRINEARAQWVILDLTGMPVLDEEITTHLAQLVGAVRLLGCRCVITGLSPQVARAFTAMDMDIGDAIPMGTLMQGIQHCMAAKAKGARGGRAKPFKSTHNR